MVTLTLELPSRKTRTAFNLRRWGELLADRELAKVEGRIETDRHGHITVGGGQPVRGSKVCPQFPRQVKLRCSASSPPCLNR
jgi:hypothetical protein